MQLCISIKNSILPPENFLNDVVWVNHDGLIFQVSESFLTIRCSPNADKSQWQCKMKFGSWAYDDKELTLQSNSNPITLELDYSDDSNNVLKDWKIVNNKGQKNFIEYPCCPDVKYADITYTFTLARRD